jgi:hypothetical protein
MERATLALREPSPPQVQIDTNPTFLGPEPVGTPRGDQMRAWAEALDRPRTTQTEPNNSRPSQQTLPAGTNRSTAPPPQVELSVNDLMSTLIRKLDELGQVL